MSHVLVSGMPTTTTTTPTERQVSSALDFTTCHSSASLSSYLLPFAMVPHCGSLEQQGDQVVFVLLGIGIEKNW